MFRKKVSEKVVAAVAGAASTSAASTPPSTAARPPRSGGIQSKTQALIEKHRKIVEEAKRHQKEMKALTKEQETLRPPPPHKDRHAPPPPAPARFATLVDDFLAATQPLADLDETIQENSPTAAEALQPPSVSPHRAAPDAIVTYRSFAASLVCPKKFYLLQNRPDLIPKASLGDMMHYDDSVGFNELARRWDRLQFGSRAVLVKEGDFQQAAQHTEELIISYFQGPYRSLGEQAPSLTIHRPALAVTLPEFSRPSEGAMEQRTQSHATAAAMQLRARPAVLRYRPRDNQWVVLESQAVIDPVSTPSRIATTVQRFHFTILCLRWWLTRPHLPIEVRKKFLQVDLDRVTKEIARGHALESSARPAAPIDLKRSGLLHIRQFFPGPATLMDCDPPRLVKYIQRLSLEELLAEDSQYYNSGKSTGKRTYQAAARGGGGQYFSHHGLGGGGSGGGGAFDIHNLHPCIRKDPVLTACAEAVEPVALEVSSFQQGRSTRGPRQKEEAYHRLFEAEHNFMEQLLMKHTLQLVQHHRKVTTGTSADGNHLTAFSHLMGDEGFVRSTAAAADPAAVEDAEMTASGTKSKRGTTVARKVKAAAATARGKRKASASDGDESNAVLGGCSGADIGASGGEVDGCIAGPVYARYIGTHCQRGGEACPFFTEGMCLPRKVEDPMEERDNHLFTLPSTSLTRKADWWAQGKRTVRDVLDLYERQQTGMRLTSAQLRYAHALVQGQVALNPKEIDAFFARIQYPLFVIDFEAVQFALPPFAKEVAYQSIPFQFSLDVFQHDVLTEEPTHYNYLHFGKGCSPNTDPRPGCVAELVRIVRLERERKRRAMEASGELAHVLAEREAAAAAAAGAEGSVGRRRAPKPPKVTKANPLEQPRNPCDGTFVAHFASFEKACLEKLGQLEEAYKEEIKEFWFLDTLDLIKKGYVHPNAQGSNSLKKVLPALCPDFQYGIFGSETEAVALDVVDGVPSSSDSATAAGVGGGQDEQKGENAMGVYRLWYHMEGGGTVQDLERAKRSLSGGQPSKPPASQHELHPPANAAAGVRTTMAKEEREHMWHTLRHQLLEYCSLDTKALYEIMREIHREREAARHAKPLDKSGWVFIDPIPREIDL